MHDVLRGVKIVEVAQWWFAPSAAALLAEWGAEVVKIEHPLHGDPLRGLTTGGAMAGSYDINFMFEQANHGKRSIGLDISQPEGRAVLDRLIAESDVFITSFLPSVRDKLALDVEDVRAVNPDIIYARAHGAGNRGPERERGGFDSAVFWARGSVVHHLTPAAAGSPIPPRPSFGDGISGLGMAGAVAAALFGRERHGQPSVIDISLLATAAWVMSPDVCAAALIPGGLRPSTREELRNPLANCFRTSDDRWIWLAMLQADRYWAEFCERIGRPDLAADERFSADQARVANLRACMSELDTEFAAHPLSYWREKLNGLSGVWAVVQTATELLDDPQVIANGYVADVDYNGRTHRLVPSPAQFDAQRPVMTRAPESGEHTDEILGELGKTLPFVTNPTAATAETGVDEQVGCGPCPPTFGRIGNWTKSSS
ncbi:CaiB/BaiF CoA-transferase family protein [Amycolatopsis sp. GM8]|uniref:CaiB/BaiF CoA transferase family protein n=1 Tax=Amycolatopsis sp. GM8 TaxID=2896530 RepID=UPI001F160563|nr:CoA transferase [Amycolatopsis sp. GM8]